MSASKNLRLLTFSSAVQSHTLKRYTSFVSVVVRKERKIVQIFIVSLYFELYNIIFTEYSVSDYMIYREGLNFHLIDYSRT